MAKKKTMAMHHLVRYDGELHKRYGNAILLYKYEDTYGAVYEDASEVAKICGLELNREYGNGGYMVNFPHDELETHLHKLVCAKKRIAIIDGDIIENIKATIRED